MSYCFSTNNIIFAVKGSNCRKTNGMDFSSMNKNQLMISFCNRSNRFVLQMYLDEVEREPLCLHCDNIIQEKEEMDLFIMTEAKTVHFIQENGRTIDLPLSEFDYNREEGYLEHSSENIAINIFKPLNCSYTYTYNSHGEIEDRNPIYDVVIY